jgi:hypothetical protein
MEIESFNKAIMLRTGHQADDLGRHVTVRAEQRRAEDVPIGH